MAHIFPLSTLRARLTEALELALHDPEPVVISRNGKRVAAIVSMADLERIWKDEDYELYGPINPDTGRRNGAAWVQATGWRRPLAEAEVIARADRDAEEQADRDRQFAELDASMRAFDERQAKREAERAAPKLSRPQKRRWFGFHR